MFLHPCIPVGIQVEMRVKYIVKGNPGLGFLVAYKIVARYQRHFKKKGNSSNPRTISPGSAS